MTNKQAVCDYLQELEAFVQARNRKAQEQKQVEADIAQVFEAYRKATDADFDEAKQTYETFKKKRVQIDKELVYYENACQFASIWALRQMAYNMLVAIRSDQKLIKAKTHHKKFKNWKEANFPNVRVYTDETTFNFYSNAIPYEFSKKAEFYIWLGWNDEKAFNHEAVCEWLDKLDFPTEPTETIINRYIKCKEEYNEIIQKAFQETQEIKNKIGYSTSLFAGREQEDIFRF